MSKIRYGVSNRAHGKPPLSRPLKDGEGPDASRGEVLVERGPIIGPEEVWDEGRKTVRERTDAEKLEFERTEKVRELERAADAAMLAEFGGLVSVMLGQALLNPQEPRVKRALDHYRNLEAKTNQAKDASREQLKTITF